MGTQTSSESCARQPGPGEKPKESRGHTVPERISNLVRCCKCLSRLESSDDGLDCINPECQAVYPVVRGIPVIIDEKRSIFSFEDFTLERDTFFPTRSPMKRLLTRLVPRISKNVAAKKNYRRLADLMAQSGRKARVLVVGGSIVGEGMEDFISDQRFEFVETDVSFGPRCSIICDGHDLPFEEGSFDGVVVQAVLEHVADPIRCVKELHRVLKPGGHIYADTPFMQQVHSRAYDFTRYTHLGHRRLFREFSEMESGASCGPGMALAWSYEYFLLSFVSGRRARQIVTLIARISSFPLVYSDHFLVKTAGGLDGASSCYFIGCKSGTILSDRELLTQYRGAQ